MPDEPSADLLDRVRKLLAKAEGEGVTPHEAEALTAKAAELMARYGIDRARLAAARPETDRPADRVFDIDNPWASVKIYLLAQVASALRCVCIEVDRPRGRCLHVFGYASDLERTAILYASLLVQMNRALAAEQVPVTGASARAWRRSWMLGYAGAAAARLRAAEDHAVQAAGYAESSIVPAASIVLASRAEVVNRLAEEAYPHTRETRVTFGGTGYQDGYREGGKADIGGATLARRGPAGLGRLSVRSHPSGQFLRRWRLLGLRIAGDVRLPFRGQVSRCRTPPIFEAWGASDLAALNCGWGLT
jgi:hypothetical protein